GLQSAVVSTFSWYYALVVTTVLVFVLWLLFSRFRDVRLGAPDSEPEFGYLSWFSMLFSAGIGTGIVFWGVAEPLYHYAEPPLAGPQTPEAVSEAMLYAFFHWGLHPWAIYALFGAAIAFFHFRQNLPLAL